MQTKLAAGLFFAATTALVSVSLAGKWNGTEIITTTSIAKVKVVKTDGAPELLELTPPTTTGRLGR
ncbi:MAG: hypothetical protein AB7K71_18665 [Polyangiaceae bacterium]